MYKKFTHEEFLEKVWEKNEYYRNGDFKILSKYKGQTTKIIVKDRYGYVKVYPHNFFKNFKTSIISAIFPTNYFSEKLMHYNIKFYNREFKLIGQYTKNKIEVKGKFSNHLIKPSSLLMNQNLEIRNSTNKELYIINKAKCVHGDKYDYSKLVYKAQIKKSTIICKKHGEFQQIVKDHLNGEGCYDCGRERSTYSIQKNPTGWSYSNWQKAAEKSKNFDSYKVYLIKCWNDDEEFYKIGRTFLTVDKRFKLIPYNCDLINIITFDNARETCIFEQDFKNKNIEYSYIPNIIFNGMQECFYKIIDR